MKNVGHNCHSGMYIVYICCASAGGGRSGWSTTFLTSFPHARHIIYEIFLPSTLCCHILECHHWDELLRAIYCDITVPFASQYGIYGYIYI